VSTSRPVVYATQRSRRGGWKTVVVDAERGVVETAFEKMVKANPAGYFRVIELIPREQSASGQREFDWKLLVLYDPKRGAISTGRMASQHAGRTKNRIYVPVRLYLVAIVIGLLAGAVAVLVWGPWAGT